MGLCPFCRAPNDGLKLCEYLLPCNPRPTNIPCGDVSPCTYPCTYPTFPRNQCVPPAVCGAVPLHVPHAYGCHGPPHHPQGFQLDPGCAPALPRGSALGILAAVTVCCVCVGLATCDLLLAQFSSFCSRHRACSSSPLP
jgi:hypothetical protein